MADTDIPYDPAKIEEKIQSYWKEQWIIENLFFKQDGIWVSPTIIFGEGQLVKIH